MLWGYLKCQVEQRKRSVNREEARFYSKMLNRRLLGQWSGSAAKSGVGQQAGSHN
jgi:hypothetical protein